jgi:hypothetical protein
MTSQNIMRESMENYRFVQKHTRVWRLCSKYVEVATLVLNETSFWTAI